LNKILLIPPVINPIFEDKNFMPLGLLAIAASLRNKGFSPTIYHPLKRLIRFPGYNSVAKKILKEKPQIIGFSTWCISYPALLLVAKQIKKLAPEIPILFGGPQASILARETLLHFLFVDFVLAGEADFTFPLFLNELNNSEPDYSRIPGLTYRTKSGNVHQNPMNGAINNLDDLPVPAYDLIPGSKSLKLDVGRGCPFKCSYCTTNDFFSKKYRVKSAKRILHEMNSAFETSKIDKFSFAHDMFTLNKKFIEELCSALIGQKNAGINYTWTCSARIDCVTEKMLAQMKHSGCEAIFFGIESGSEKIQKSIGKNLKIGKAYEVAEICRETGLNMHASFIMGFPDETTTDLEKSLRCALQLATNGALVQFSELSLLPGTPLYEEHHSELKFDGLFSNFSNTFCRREEIELICQFPPVFSSFYYLPVKTLSHAEMSFLCQIINSLSNFRNTLFLLRKLLLADIEGIKLLHLFKTWHNPLQKDDYSNTPIISHPIRFLRTYILENTHRINIPELNDIFAFEAFQGLILARFNRWQLIKQQLKNGKKTNPFQIIPTPAWNILTTSYRLNKVILSENNWDTTKIRKRKGRYTYLIVANSPNKCKRYQINQTDEYLLQNLSESTIDEYVAKVGSDVTKKDVVNWLKRMKKLGVIEIH
jgi:radical SAM superfamily enzyme YgiQ (UPF0313 family)